MATRYGFDQAADHLYQGYKVALGVSYDENWRDFFIKTTHILINRGQATIIRWDTK